MNYYRFPTPTILYNMSASPAEMVEIEYLNLGNVSGFYQPRTIGVPFKPTPVLDYAFTYANDIYEELSPIRLYHVRVIRWVDPVNIWLRLKSVDDRIGELEGNMQMWYDGQDGMLEHAPLDHPQFGMPCAIRSRFDGRWYRGIIDLLPNVGNLAVVLCVDWGYREFVELENIKPLWNMFANVAPGAVNVRLFGVQTAQLSVDRIERANKYFKKLGPDFACRFEDAVRPLWSGNKPHRIELYPLNYFGGVAVGQGLAGLDREFKPERTEDLAVKSKIFDLIHRKNDQKVYGVHRYHTERKKRDRKGYFCLVVNDKEVIVDEQYGLIHICGHWYPWAEAVKKNMLTEYLIHIYGHWFPWAEAVKKNMLTEFYVSPQESGSEED